MQTFWTGQTCVGGRRLPPQGAKSGDWRVLALSHVLTQDARAYGAPRHARCGPWRTLCLRAPIRQALRIRRKYTAAPAPPKSTNATKITIAGPGPPPELVGCEASPRVPDPGLDESDGPTRAWLVSLGEGLGLGVGGGGAAAGCDCAGAGWLMVGWGAAAAAS